MKTIICLFVLPARLVTGTFAAEPMLLPEVASVFTIACQQNPEPLPNYFDDESLLALYPRLKPSKVVIAVGGKRAWQSGVIVTKDKKCLFWKTCSAKFIVIYTADGTYYFAEEPEVHIE